jgi:3-deoxy-D-manno-octulosonic-acid transferase
MRDPSSRPARRPDFPGMGYALLRSAMLPFVPLRLLWRSRREPEYRRHWGERFGRYAPRPAGPVIWVHAVSLGETHACAPLVRLLKARYPGASILTTHMTPTGRAASKRLFGSAALRSYLPYDYRFAVRAFLTHFRPTIGILMETELWPILLAESRRAEIPLALVNARMSERSARGYRRFPRLASRMLGSLSVLAAQSEADAQRLRGLGSAEPAVCGNLKFDVDVPDDMLTLGTRLRRAFGPQRPVWLAASTREGEEALVLDAYARCALPDALLVLVPRHPQRFDDVARLLHERGLRCQRRSENAPIRPDTQVVLGDSMGEMFAYYAASDVAFVGGSLVRTGGQNLIEACAVGVPVLVGPHTFNFEAAAEAAVAAGAARRVADSAQLGTSVRDILGDEALRGRMRRAGLAFAGAHQGAARRILELLEPFIAIDGATATPGRRPNGTRGRR